MYLYFYYLIYININDEIDEKYTPRGRTDQKLVYIRIIYIKFMKIIEGKPNYWNYASPEPISLYVISMC